MSAQPIFQRLAAHWQNAKIPLLPGVDPAEIDRVFDALNAPLSDDVRRLYATIGGSAGNEMDENMFSLWSLGRIGEDRLERHGGILYFADFLISSHEYGLRYLNSAISEVVIDHYGGSSAHPPYVIAPSVEVFFERYLQDPWLIEVPV